MILLIYFRKTKQIGYIQLALAKGSDILTPYNKAVSIIASQNWKSEIIKEIIASYDIDQSGQLTSLVKLKKIIDQLDYRLNLVVGITLNIFCLWDFRVVNKLFNWQKNNQGRVIKLFEVIGKFEVLSSLATWAYNHPDYNYGNIIEDDFQLLAKSLKHPLIPDQISVANDFIIKPGQYASIITGSNMAGKSTFLRTVGVNMILTYVGTTADCESLSFSPVQIMSYMRIKDALEENVSTFKAELNRVEQMLHLIQSGKPCLILIDEMLRGTNSKDKLKGSMAITKKLIQHEAYALIATHDIKLTTLQKEFPKRIKNYYFDIEFHEEELQFDYKIKEGICENFNASYLLKQIGIE